MITRLNIEAIRNDSNLIYSIIEENRKNNQLVKILESWGIYQMILIMTYLSNFWQAITQIFDIGQ